MYIRTMSKHLRLLLLLALATACTFAQDQSAAIIPQPVSTHWGNGNFFINAGTVIVADESERPTVDFFNNYLQRIYGLHLPVRQSGGAGSIRFETKAPSSPKEGRYELHVAAGTVTITGDTHEGTFYGMQTLIQLLPVSPFAATTAGPVIHPEAGGLFIPVVDIEDYPRFGYRGLHLDVGRHFFPVDFVKKYIDYIALHKMNYFHWHLTEDQGWRIEIKKYPKLTEVGSKRTETVKDRNLSPYVGDATPHEGFYTQEQIKDVVAYAKARYITVIPEIELPGHSSAALAAYPELGCKADYKYKVQTTWGIFKEVYCPTEKTFGFLEDVLTEVIGLFPDSPYIHIGGDEVLKDMWKDSPEVKELMARENLKDTNE